MSFVYIINRPPTKVLTGENFDQVVLREYLLSHLELATMTDATANPVQYDGQACTLISPVWNTGPTPSTVSDDLTFAKFELQDGRVLYVGHLTDQPPTPQDLQRDQLVDGYDLMDTTGQAWQIPIARSPRGRETLPTEISFDLQTGAVNRTRQVKFDALWNLANRVWDTWNSDEDRKVEPEFNTHVAIIALQINYRISRVELNALQQMGRAVLTDVKAAAAAMILIDLDLVAEHAEGQESKKNEAVAVT